MTEQHPKTENCLNRDAVSVENPAFEIAIANLQKSHFHDFSVNKLQIVGRLQEHKGAQKDFTMCLPDKALHRVKMTRISA